MSFRRKTISIISFQVVFLGSLLFFSLYVGVKIGSKHKDYWEADLYKEANRPQSEWAASALMKYDFRGDEYVLDIGCGTGEITAKIAQNFPQSTVIGIDASPGMIRAAQEHHSLENLNFAQANALDFELENTFDLIISFNCLHWIKDQKRVLHQIRKHLKPGGCLIISLSPPPKKHPLRKAITKTILKKKWWSYLRDFQEEGLVIDINVEQYRNLLEKEGFTVAECESIEKTTYFPSTHEFASWVRAWIPHIGKIPEKMRVQFAEEVAVAFAEQTSQTTSGEIVFTHNPWEIYAYYEE